MSQIIDAFRNFILLTGQLPCAVWDTLPEYPPEEKNECDDIIYLFSRFSENLTHKPSVLNINQLNQYPKQRSGWARHLMHSRQQHKKLLWRQSCILATCYSSTFFYL